MTPVPQKRHPPTISITSVCDRNGRICPGNSVLRRKIITTRVTVIFWVLEATKEFNAVKLIDFTSVGFESIKITSVPLTRSCVDGTMMYETSVTFVWPGKPANIPLNMIVIKFMSTVAGQQIPTDTFTVFRRWNGEIHVLKLQVDWQLILPVQDEFERIPVSPRKIGGEQSILSQ